MFGLRDMLDQIRDGARGLRRRRLMQWISKSFL